LYSRGNGLLKEEKSLEEIHKIREKLSEMDKKDKTVLLKMNPFFNNTTTLVKITRDLEENFKINFDIFK